MSFFRLLASCFLIIFVFSFTCQNGNSQTSSLFSRIMKSNLSALQAEKFESIESKPYADAASVLRVNVDYLDEKNLSITLNDRVSFAANRIESEIRTDDDVSWIGRPEDSQETGEYVILEHTSEGLTGSIWVEGTLYSISPLGSDVVTLYRVDQDELPPEHPEGWTPEVSADGKVTTAPFSKAQSTSSTTSYSILVTYTPAAESASQDIDGLINTAVSQADMIYENSGAMIEPKLAKKRFVNYNEVDIYTDRDRLIGKNDGYMDNVHMYRNQYNADIVFLVVEGNSTYGACGIVKEVKAIVSTAFAVVQRECIDKYSFTHEIGHLFGADHEKSEDNTPNQPYKYNHGFLQGKSTFGTLLTIKQTAERIPYLSNPGIRYEYENTYYYIGTECISNAARIHNERISTVSNFRIPPPTVAIDGPTSLGYNETGTFTASPSGGTGTYTNYRWWMRKDEGGIEASPNAPPPGVWISMDSWEGQQTVQTGTTYDFSLKVEVTDSNDKTGTDVHSVEVASFSYSDGSSSTKNSRSKGGRARSGSAAPRPLA